MPHLDQTPILVGAGQFTDKTADPAAAYSPLEMMAKTAQDAFRDAGFEENRNVEIDYLVVVRGIGNTLRGLSESLQRQVPDSGAQQYLAGKSEILPKALIDRLGLHPTQYFVSSTGGNTPQMLVNATAEKIATGEVGIALLTGAEALNTAIKALKTGVRLNWDIPVTHEAPLYSPQRDGYNVLEKQHQLTLPVHNYPLFENGLRGHYGWSILEHRKAIGKLFSRFTEVAATHPGAWFPQAKTAEELITPTPQNRMVNFPYTKLLNSMLRVNQSASLLMTSIGKAQELGISQDKWIYLHGCGDAHDRWHVSERVNYCSSPAIATIGKRALQMAGVSIEEIDYFDFYSCFPSIVQITRDMLGIPKDDPRRLTVTGGLPYHGGPGNNYVMHSIATMMNHLRAHPGKRGLVTANGWYITKHSMGIYSNQPPPSLWRRTAPAEDQKIVDAKPGPNLAFSPTGKGTVETYTVIFNHEGAPQLGIIVGRTPDGARFLANTPKDTDLLANLVEEDPLGIPGRVEQQNGQNLFSPV